MKKSLILQTKDMEQRDNCKASQMFQKKTEQAIIRFLLCFLWGMGPHIKRTKPECLIAQGHPGVSMQRYTFFI